jgi:hypothetical protein
MGAISALTSVLMLLQGATATAAIAAATTTHALPRVVSLDSLDRHGRGLSHVMLHCR